MKVIDTIAELEALYDATPSEAAMRKVAPQLTPLYRKWIMSSRFCIVSTVGPDGTDGSPRGDIDPVVSEFDPKTLAMPDWRGNNRLDTLRNIVSDGRISLMFMVPGSTTVVRVNGTAQLSADPEITQRFETNGKHPKSVILITIAEIYTQCARALMRSELWTSGDQSADLPRFGEILTEMTNGEFDGVAYEAEWPERAAKSMW